MSEDGGNIHAGPTATYSAGPQSGPNLGILFGL
jgi:hypothetical protein